MRATRKQAIEQRACRPSTNGETGSVVLSDEFLGRFLDNVFRGENRQRVLEHEAQNGLAEDGEVAVSSGTRQGAPGTWQGLLAKNLVMILPRATVVIGGEERILQLEVGTTVAEVRERCGLSSGFQGILDSVPVADNYPIIRDCRLVFRPSVEELAADLCSVMRSHGLCHQREDGQNWISFSELFEIVPGKEVRGLSPAERNLLSDKEAMQSMSPESLDMLYNGELRKLSEKELKNLFEDEGIRTRKPSPQRLLVHCGDWCHFLARRIRQREQVLDAAADPKEIMSSTAALNLEAGLRRLYRRKKGGK